MIPDEAVEAALWVVLVVAGYVALFSLIPAGPDNLAAVAAFTVLVLASGALLILQLRKARK